MRKIASLVCATTLSLALVACGGGGSGQEASGDDAAKTKQTEQTEVVEEKEPAKPEEKFYGTWLAGGMETNGVVMVGDLSEMGLKVSLEIKDDGTAVMTYAGEEVEDEESKDVTWELTDENSITLTSKIDDEGSESKFKVEYKDEYIVLTDLDEESDDVYVMYLSHDGTIKDYPTVDVSGAKAVTDESKILGTWKVDTMAYSGFTAYGDLTSFYGETTAEEVGDNLEVTFEKDGKATFATEEYVWEKTDDGITLHNEGDEMTIVLTMDVLALDDDTLVLRLSGDWAAFDMAYICTR